MFFCEYLAHEGLLCKNFFPHSPFLRGQVSRGQVLASFFTSPLSPPCEGGERGVVILVAALLSYEILSLLLQWDVPNFCHNILSLRSKCPVYIFLDSRSHFTCNINIQITGNGIFTIPDLLIIHRPVLFNR